ncbi:hypothetical protein [Adhaeribacter aquaticus]|uniref:hypothetical protein n=1 Tax=Adhaeribacter aquaticus TaxID=299567 RepID=UPI000405D747|nr:hypothetical protein [Adhaeribacter aquaticus]
MITLTQHKITNILLSFIFLGLSYASPARAQIKAKSAPFEYIPEQSEDQYNQRIPQKAHPIGSNNFIILSKKSANDYAVELYSSDLKKIWQTSVPLSPGEDIEAFAVNSSSAIILTNRKPSGAGSQAVYGTLINLQTGKKAESKKLFEAPAQNRRIGTAISPNGTKLVAYKYSYQQDELKAINASVYDENLNKVSDRSYNLQDLNNILSANVQINDTGEQFVSLITHNATKLSVRRYINNNKEIKGMDVQVGGLFDGQQVYVLDSKFLLQPDGSVYAAIICADEKTGNYHSLKVARFDFTAGNMKFAPEFRFNPEYVAALNKVTKSGEAATTRLEDIYLTDLLVNAEKNLVVIAEKKYNEGPKLPFLAKEMHLFAFDDFLNPTWHSVINKSQKAAASEGFSSISYKANLVENSLQVVTLEALNGKTDLYSRKINLRNGATDAPKPMGLGITSTEGLPYVKDFTTWLNEKTLIAVVRPSKKSMGLQLIKITLK